MMQLTATRPSVMALTDITKRAERLGINIDVGDDLRPNDKANKYESHIN